MKILWFDDIEVWNQPVFDLPLIGRVSIRQMCIIGLALILTFSIRDLLVAVISFSITLPLAMLKYRSLRFDELALNITIYMIIYKVYPLLRHSFLLLSNTKKVMIIVMVTSIVKRYLVRNTLKNNKSNSKEIVVNADTIRLKLRLVNKDGRRLAGRLATIYLDDDHISSIVSDSNGEIEALVSLSNDDHKVSNGLHTLKVMVDGKVVFMQGIKLSRPV